MNYALPVVLAAITVLIVFMIVGNNGITVSNYDITIARLPAGFVGGYYSFEKRSGVYSKNDTKMVVSRGLGPTQIPVRILNPPEIVVVRLL